MIIELWSHPDKLLLIHSREVATVALENIKGKRLHFTLDIPGQHLSLNEILNDLVYLSAAFHDLGKATEFFQKYIRNPDLPHDKRKSHALLSAVFVFFVIEKYLKSKAIDHDLARFCSVFAFSAVKRHHGKLINLSDELLIDQEWRELLPELSKSIDISLVQPFIDELIKDFSFTVDWSEFLSFINDEAYNEILDDFSFEVLQDSLKKVNSKTRLTLYYFHQIIYSALLFADKNEVILTDKSEKKKANVSQMIDEYRDTYGFNVPKS